MKRKPLPGLFVTGTDTGVGKTYVAAMIIRALTAAGLRVGPYKPVASGCRWEQDQRISDDAIALWQASGCIGDLETVCPQRFAAALAPHRAAEAEGKRIDAKQLRAGLDYWCERSDVLVVEGAGGLLSPVTDDELVADLAHDFGFPLLIVARNALGAINQTLQTVITARFYRGGLPIAGIVLNTAMSNSNDPSMTTNRLDIERHTHVPVLTEIPFEATEIQPFVDWIALAANVAPLRRAGGR
jgi:dethiobiotin synthetase